jgi:hypothetical protein
MTLVIPPHTSRAGDPGHPDFHNDISDVLSLLAQALAQLAGSTQGSDAAMIAAIQAFATTAPGYSGLLPGAAPPAVSGLIQQFIQWSAGVTTFPAVPGVLHLASASGGNITMQLPPAVSVNPGGALIVKRVDSSGNTVTVAPVSGERVNGLTAGVVLSQQGQGRWFMPNAPAGPAAGTGWMSF